MQTPQGAESIPAIASALPQASHYDAPPASPHRELQQGLFDVPLSPSRSSTPHIPEERSSSPDSRRVVDLYKAAGKGALDVVEALIKGGESVHASGRHGESALHNAAKHNHAAVVRLLLAHGAGVGSLTEERLTPLHSAASKGAVAALAVLLEAKSAVNARDSEGRTALHLAASGGHTEACEALVKAGADLAICNEEGEAALHAACDKGHSATAAALIGLGADVNQGLNAAAADEEHDCPSPLQIAAGAGHEACVSLLISKGASVNAADAAGCTALMRAAAKGRDECVTLLLRAGAGVNANDESGRNVLHKAAGHDKGEVIRLLLQQSQVNALLELQDSSGYTPLHSALHRTALAAAEVLINAGANSQGGLHAAVTGAARDPEAAKLCVELLLRHIPLESTAAHLADAKAAAELARQGDHEAILNLLSQRFHSAAAVVIVTSSRSISPAPNNHSAPLSPAPSPSHLGASLDSKGSSSPSISPRRPGSGSVDPLSRSASAAVITRPGASHSTAGEGPRDSPQRPGIAAAAKRFNVKAKEGVEFLLAEKLIDSTPASLARFLHEAPGLSKERVGEYLGHRDNTLLLKAFVEHYDFAGLSFDAALRRFLSKFRLPGEAQVIDRFMVAFAARYCALNASHPFANEDAAYILAFSLIMLNTDRHNPNVKRKMTKEEFIRTNRGINGGADLPAEFLEGLFDAIVKEEIKLDGSNAMFSNAERKGMLTKQGGRVKSWKSRWFVLTDNCLYYFRTEKDPQPLGIIPLENLAVRVVTREKDKHMFELYHPNHEELKACKMNSDKALVRGNHESYLIRAATREDMDEWIRCLETNIQSNPLIELINKRKKLAQAAVHAPANPAPRAEFKELLTAAQLCFAAAKGPEYFRNKFGESAVFNFARCVCFLTSHASTKTHQIVILSRLDESDELRNALLLCKDLAAFKSFSLVENFQFRQSATDVYNRVKTSLNKEYSITIAAHSLGAVIAIMLALHVHNAQWKLTKVITFGQPRFLSEKGVQAVSALPLLRVTDSKDIVHCAFPLLFHAGAELMLLTDPYYHLNERAPQQRDLKQSMLEEKTLNAALVAHSPEAFVKRLQARLQNSKAVTEIEVNMYM